MKVKEYLNINKEDVDLKNNNIFIPICLGNKFFSEKGVLSQNVKDYFNWALANTKEKVLFIVVDRIQDTNFFVRSGKSEISSIAHVLKEGDIIKNALEEFVQQLPKDQQDIISIIKWGDYQNSDPLWGHITHIVYKEFKNNSEFRDYVLNCVKTSVVDRKFSEEDYLRLCDYVLDEFCLAYSGLKYEGTHFGLYVYPATDSVLDFIEAIKRGDIFQKIQAKLPDIKTGVVILN